MRCTDSNIHLGMEVLNRRWKTLQIQFFCKITANINFNFTFILILFGSLIQTGHGWTDYTPWSIPFRQIEMDKISKMYPTNYGFKTNFGKHNGNLVVGPYEKWMRAHLELKLNEIWNKKKLLLKTCLKGTSIKSRNFKLRTYNNIPVNVRM